MIKKLFIFISLIALIYVPITFAHSQTSIIHMTSLGFEPQEITVDENSEVLFINQDNQDRWPASNIHPTHLIYPQFDPKKPIRPGSSWSFKPKKVGKWKYHDHLLPHIRGAIIVRNEKFEVEGGILSKIFASVKRWLQEFIDKFSAALPKTKQIDAAKRWQDLKLKYKSQAGSSGDIHDQAHLAGSLLYQEKGFLGIGLCSPEFAFGCFHGFLDEAFKKDLNKLDAAFEACSKLGSGLSGPVASCIHGIGHGVASFYQTSDLNSALATCDRLAGGSTYCHDGVFMEFGRNAAPNFYKAENPLYPCNDVEERYVFSCGRNQPNVLMQRFKLKFDDVVDLCLRARNNDFKSACFDSLGFIAVSSGNGDPSLIADSCNKIDDVSSRSKCLQAAAGELIFQNIPGWQESSRKLCQSLINESQKSCFEYIDKIKKDYGRI